MSKPNHVLVMLMIKFFEREELRLDHEIEYAKERYDDSVRRSDDTWHDLFNRDHISQYMKDCENEWDDLVNEFCATHHLIALLGLILAEN